jgi:hypothetical protein
MTGIRFLVLGDLNGTVANPCTSTGRDQRQSPKTVSTIASAQPHAGGIPESLTQPQSYLACGNLKPWFWNDYLPTGRSQSTNAEAPFIGLLSIRR